MTKKYSILLLLASTTILASCGNTHVRQNHSSQNSKVSFRLNTYKTTNVATLKGTATKGATIIFKPQNTDNETEKIEADSDDGKFFENSLLPGNYTVHATLHGKSSSYKKLKVTDYTAEHADSDINVSETASDSSRASSAADSEYSSISESIKKSNAKESTNSSYKSRYKSVSLDDFIGNPERYEGKNIKTSGTVSYIQRESDNNTMDYVVLNNSDASAATVTEIEVEDMHDNHITEGDNITVEGGGLTQTVKLHGKTLKSDIIVDSVIVN
ncbi:hypothetical protein [Levilactobacillus brevis]|uniref:hypothetical protein n=1 Tax=Levilactobacillus brevis TaxID=1580 RepID=UPI001C018BDF|nr:hypothetical protein [Levilactobacillus brevis]MBT9677725.1 hypothetical protein [Levilactobacillus brevis]